MAKSNKKTSCRNYHAEWKKKNITKITVEFNKNKPQEMALLEALRKKQPSMQGYIKTTLMQANNSQTDHNSKTDLLNYIIGKLEIKSLELGIEDIYLKGTNQIVIYYEDDYYDEIRKEIERRSKREDD